MNHLLRHLLYEHVAACLLEPPQTTFVVRDGSWFYGGVARRGDVFLGRNKFLDHFGDGLDPEVREAVERALDVYRGLGADVQEIELPHSRFAVACYYLVAPSEASSNLARYDGIHYGRRTDDHDGLVEMYSNSRGTAFGTEVKRRIMLGTYALSAGYYDAYYLKAQKVRRLIRQDYSRAFADVDVIASPVAPTPAVRLGQLTDDPLQMYLADAYTISANLAGLPGVSIPAGFSQDGRPIGLQLLANSFAEDRLLRAAAMHERETDWHLATPTFAGDAC